MPAVWAKDSEVMRTSSFGAQFKGLKAIFGKVLDQKQYLGKAFWQCPGGLAVVSS